jgi:hypothetical protein
MSTVHGHIYVNFHVLVPVHVPKTLTWTQTGARKKILIFDIGLLQHQTERPLVRQKFSTILDLNTQCRMPSVADNFNVGAHLCPFVLTAPPPLPEERRIYVHIYTVHPCVVPSVFSTEISDIK